VILLIWHFISEFQNVEKMTDKLHQVNDDVNSLDDHIALLVGKAAVPTVDLAAWKQTASEWRKLFAEEVDRSILGTTVFGISDSDLETWNNRLDGWRTKVIQWDKDSTNIPPAASVAGIVEKHLPEASADTLARVQTRAEEIKQAAQSKPTWEKFVWLGGAVLGLGALGLVLSSVARIEGR
jgi:hypothetical protein